MPSPALCCSPPPACTAYNTPAASANQGPRVRMSPSQSERRSPFALARPSRARRMSIHPPAPRHCRPAARSVQPARVRHCRQEGVAALGPATWPGRQPRALPAHCPQQRPAPNSLCPPGPPPLFIRCGAESVVGTTLTAFPQPTNLMTAPSQPTSPARCRARPRPPPAARPALSPPPR